jgi:polysaccharide export outer membrane protein
MNRKQRALAMNAMATLLAIAGCDSLPRSGPDDTVIRDHAIQYQKGDASKAYLGYVLVDLTARVLTYFPQLKPQTLSKGFGSSRGGPPTLPLGIGDVVEVTLFESSAGGLFIPAEAGSRPGNFVNLPQQTVDTDGAISIPYAGRISAAGKTPAQLQSEIVARLADRAIEPQAIINLVKSRSSEIAVLGDVNSPAKLELNPGGERVLDVISRAGGISTPNAETTITLQRHGTIATVPFDMLLSSPKENIYVYPGDVIFANRDRRTYLAFGASGLNGRVDFDDSDLTLGEAVAKAGGLLDSRADPGQVFLYRLVSPKTASAMGMPATAKSGKGFPVIFRVNMRDPSTYFLAQQFPMEDKDIIYVSNSNSVELVKFLDIINSATSGIAGPAADAVTIDDAVRTLN